MEKYESKQVKINKPASMVYMSISDFNNFTPMLQDKVDDWNVDGDTCSFKIKGFPARLRIMEKTPCECIKITGDEGSPFEFFFWIQLKQIADNDTRMKLTMHVKLNMMMKMMVGKKLEKGIDEMAEKMAEAFNNIPG
ncbi:MAG: polyketide cyclase [Rikenellaceae bacterium]|nr:polyketide cyclase [Rikenellaceae bacterium]